MLQFAEITALRLRMLEAGYAPIPLNGKVPVLEAWQARTIGADDIRKWEADFKTARDTGSTCRNMPTFDIDILNPDAAAAVENLVRERFEERGKILIRTGLAPKRAIPFRADTPFTKKLVLLSPPNGGKKQRVEFLGEGQQLVCFGTHPETHKPYHWFGGEPGPIPLDDLPRVDEDQAQQLIADAVILLTGQYNYTLAGSNAGVGPSAGHNSEKGPVDIEAEFAAMTPDNVNEKQTRVIPAMIWRGIHPNEILKEVTARTMSMAAASNKKEWTEKREAERHVVGRISSALKNLFMAEYDPATGTLPSWLCPDFHKPWIDALAAGKEPRIGRNPSGFYIRAYDPKTGEETSAKESAGESAKSDDGSTRKSTLFVIRPFAPFDPATLPPRQWLYGRHYLRRTVSCTTAPGGFGKSSLDMVENIAMATCRDLIGEQPTERLRVWYHNGEDSLDEMKRRVAAICQFYNIPQQELVGWFFMTSGNEFPLRVAEGYNKLELNKGLIKCINNQIEENEIDAVSLDPLITLHGVPESDNTKMDSVVRIFAGIADAHDCAIEISHHMRKPAAGSNGDYGAADIRGASAIHDAVRSARILNRMSEKDALDLSLQEHDRARYFRVDKAKGNYSPAIKAVWRQFINVQLPNGDDVGVIAPWNYPGQGEGTPEKEELERSAEYVFMQLLHRFTLQGEAVSTKKQGNYAPRIFAKESEARVARLNAILLENAMRRLLQKGKIKSEEVGKKGVHRIVPA